MRTIDILILNVDNRRKYIYISLIVLSILILIAETWFNLRQGASLRWRDFQYFYEAGRLVWRGELADAYYAQRFQKIVEQLGVQGFLPFTYPPQFALLMASITSLSVSASYVLFTTISLVAYLSVLKRLNPQKIAAVLFLIFPAILINVRLGQNGFLTAALVGWASLFLLKNKWSAGIPLGCLVIKPHLAVALAMYALACRKWKVIFTAILIVSISCAVSTFILGSAIWWAFLNSLREAGIFLAHNAYPLFGMVSFYASLRTLGASASLAFLAQGLLSLGVLASIAFASQRFSSSQSLGLAVLAILLISPYANSYDATILAVGFALIFDDIILFGKESEWLILYIMTILSSGYALFVTAMGGADDLDQLSPAGLGFLAVYILCFRILFRCREQKYTNPENE